MEEEFKNGDEVYCKKSFNTTINDNGIVLAKESDYYLVKFLIGKMGIMLHFLSFIAIIMFMIKIIIVIFM